jgi:glycosyltransferase involved in cell wall biosynthesis
VKKLSLIIPTKNRALILAETLNAISKCIGIEDCEIILCNDGSTDDTQKIINDFRVAHHNLTIKCFDDGSKGVAFQRNRAADLAEGTVLLFAADDIRPANTNWIMDHLRLHALQPDSKFAVLGKMTWPSSSLLPTNAVMATVQGRRGEQFGFADLEGNSFVDWRFFYTSNLSVKKNLVSNWTKNGFSLEFSEINFEDIEFAYRLYSKNELNIFYSSVPTGLHFQSMSVNQFCARQRTAGRMAVKFAELQPSVKELLLPKTRIFAQSIEVSIVLRMIDGIQAYAEWLESTGVLGTESWHTDLLHVLFSIYFNLGVIDQLDQSDSAALSMQLFVLMDQSLTDLSRNVGYTVFGQNVNFNSNMLPQNKKFEYSVWKIKVKLHPRTIHRIMGNKVLFKTYTWLKSAFRISRL